jgi:hypothetical protein
MRRLVPALCSLMVLSACAGEGASLAVSPSASPSVSVGMPSPPESPDASPSAITNEPSGSPSPNAIGGIRIDGLVRTVVEGLSVRVEPSVKSDRLGVVPSDEPAYVVDGPAYADGFAWYQLAAVRQPHRGDCGDPAPAHSLE